MNLKDRARAAAKGYIDECCYREFPDNFEAGYIQGTKDLLVELREVEADLLFYFEDPEQTCATVYQRALTKLQQLKKEVDGE